MRELILFVSMVWHEDFSNSAARRSNRHVTQANTKHVACLTVLSPAPLARSLTHGAFNTYYEKLRWFDLRWERMQTSVVINLGS